MNESIINKFTQYLNQNKKKYLLITCIINLITILFLPFVYGRVSPFLLERNYRDPEHLIFFEQLLNYIPMGYKIVKTTSQIIVFGICVFFLIINLLLILKNRFRFTPSIFFINLIWILFNLIFYTTRNVINYPLFDLTLHIGFYIMILLTLFSGFLNYAIIKNLPPRQKKPKPMELLELRIDELERKLKDKEENK